MRTEEGGPALLPPLPSSSLCTHPILCAGKTPQAPALHALLKMGSVQRGRDLAAHRAHARLSLRCQGRRARDSEGLSLMRDNGELREAPQTGRCGLRPANSKRRASQAKEGAGAASAKMQVVNPGQGADTTARPSPPAAGEGSCSQHPLFMLQPPPPCRARAMPLLLLPPTLAHAAPPTGGHGH